MRIRDFLRTGGAALTAAWWIAGAAAAPGAQPNQAPPELWLAPSGASDAAQSPLAIAVANLNAGKAEAAEPVFAKATSDPVLGGYARLYLGRAQLAGGHSTEASSSAQVLLRSAPLGRLNESALWLAADAAEDARDWPAEIRALQALTGSAIPAAERAWFRLGKAAVSAENRTLALQAFAKVYYEFALTDQAADAADEMKKLVASPFLPTPESYTLDLGRAQQLYGARRYTDARKAFDALRTLAKGPDRTLISLRLAECDYGLKRYAAARDGLRAYLDSSTTDAAEAQYFYIATMRELGHGDAYVAAAQAFVDQHPGEQLAEDTLNDLGSYYIRQDEDAKAADVFAQLTQRFPAGPHADRAAWKSGWWAFRNGDYATTVNTFQTAAVQLRRSDYRPMWLYWTARAQAASGNRDAARVTYRVVVADYRNSYYGREAARALEQLRAAPAGPSVPAPVSPARREIPPTITAGQAPPNATLIRALLAAGLYDDAIAELRTAQRENGTSPLIEATIAFALNRRGDLRPGITAMRHAYPQFIAEGGEALPASILTVIFPVDYWSLIYKYATARSLDPYLMAALIAQESTFEADVKSGANAWGLMQVLPSTGRQYAARLGIKPFRTARLTEPETNIRIGMAYFADLVRQFGDIAPALAAYNAGDDRASRWLAERPGLSRDEFIDDIPFPETQNYVKRIIGQAEDYRLLYRRPSPDAAPHHAGAGPGREP
ncbi:MAG TPA: transglycosylase SLT domain-containing protein [Vicinamibacterales bacterium]|nr:transglycosylase SLT domain-containing protein [Vicinamibacterales bacterium]